MAVLTLRLTQAVDYARIAHAAQVRRGTNIPYLAHLIGVASPPRGLSVQVEAATVHSRLRPKIFTLLPFKRLVRYISQM